MTATPTHTDLDQDLRGPVLLIMSVRDYTDETGWLHESHPDVHSAILKKRQIKNLCQGARILHTAGHTVAWDYDVEIPFGPWDDIHPRHVGELTIWFALQGSGGITQLSAEEYRATAARMDALEAGVKERDGRIAKLEAEIRDRQMLHHGFRDQPAKLRAALEPIPDRPRCHFCGRRDGLDAVVSDEEWEALGFLPGDVACLWCMDERADEQGIKLNATLHFAGKAITASNESTQEADLLNQLAELREGAIAPTRVNAVLLGGHRPQEGATDDDG